MTPAQLLNRVRALGCDLVLVQGDQLKLVGPREARAQVVELVRAHKPALLAYLPRPRPEPMAVMDHCVRVRPDSAATGIERAALADHCKALPDDGAVDALLLKLFNYWRKTSAPSLTAFLGSNKRRAVA
jgi:hypothetical protein